MPTQPAAARHPLVASFIKRKQARWSDHHRRNGIGVLNRWCAWLDARDTNLLDATGDDCTDYLNERSEAISGATAHKDYQFLMWLYEWLVREGEIDTRKKRGPMENIEAPRVAEPAPENVPALTNETYAALMATFSPREMVDCRNAAICSLMFRSGLRRSEALRVDIDRVDLNATHGPIPTLEVLGKNKQWRRIPLAHETAIWIERYLRRLGDDRPAEGALFLATWNGDQRSTGRLKAQAVSDMLERRSEKLGINITPHQFRRGFAVEARRRGMEDLDVIAIADWADNRMLKRYARSDMQDQAIRNFAGMDPTAEPDESLRRRRRGKGPLRAV